MSFRPCRTRGVTLNGVYVPQGIEHWKQFYRDHKTYRKVGKVALRPIDLKTDPPLHCIPERREQELVERAKKVEAAAEKPSVPEHQEL